MGLFDRQKDDMRVPDAATCARLTRLCPYGTDVEHKLKIAHSKLSGESYIN